MEVCKDFEFGIEVEGEVEESGKRRCGMAGWEGLKGIVDFTYVAGADGTVEHELLKALAD